MMTGHSAGLGFFTGLASNYLCRLAGLLGWKVVDCFGVVLGLLEVRAWVVWKSV